MQPPLLPQQLLSQGRFSAEDLAYITQCRGEHNRLGFAYQLAFVRLLNRFPTQEPLEIIEDIIAFTSVQLKIGDHHIEQYGKRQPTVSEHQDVIRNHLALRPFTTATSEVETFLFKEACQLEQMVALTARLREFLKENHVLEPSQDTIRRVIQTQREAARTGIYSKVFQALPNDKLHHLDALITTGESTYSPLHTLKLPPGNASPAAFTKLAEKLDHIIATGILTVDMKWLNNNFQRSLARYARQSSIDNLKDLKEERRYAVLTCFLHQLYRDTFDAAVKMYDKLMNKMYNKADKDIDEYMKKQRKSIRSSLSHYKKVLDVLLDEEVNQQDVRATIFDTIDETILKAESDDLTDMLTNKYSDSFKRVIARHSYMRQFSPDLLKHIVFQADTQDKSSDDMLEAVNLLNRMNAEGKRSLPDDAPTDFIPKKLRPFVLQDGKPQKPAWECALLTVVRDQVKSGNLFVPHSKRYANLESFFGPKAEWEANRDTFFARAGLPANPHEVPAYFTNRINQAYDRFLERLPDNQYAQLDKEGWKISSDPKEKLDYGTDKTLNPLKEWIGKHIRTIKLPELLIEVDNDLQFSRCFMPAADQENPSKEHICEVIATNMAHASEIGPYTMSQLINGVSYHRMKRITDWHMHEETQRAALAKVVNAISGLDITKAWGEGKTSSSDGQRFSSRRKVLEKSYSHAFNDFAFEFYNFIADNYAPYFVLPHECTDRDAPFVLDGMLYNESDLEIEEHYTDTHGFTDINFAAFAMFGKRFIPRIKGLKNHAIFRIDTEKDYRELSVLLEKRDRTARPEWIAQEWDRMGHYYYSLECGHATASTALRRLNGFTAKNHFYRANRELGRIFRTEYTLDFMSDPEMRQRNRRGLLKGEEIHALARDIRYGHRGKINRHDFMEHHHACNSLTLVTACIVYWQAKEIHRVLQEHTLPEDIDLSLLSHISPVSWHNIILYGDYILNRDKVVP